PHRSGVTGRFPIVRPIVVHNSDAWTSDGERAARILVALGNPRDSFPPDRTTRRRMDNGRDAPEHSPDEWAELLARTVAHLAAQLTMTQIRLRALATEVTARDPASADAVRVRVRTIATNETGQYLRENLGEALVDLIDVEALEEEIVA